MYRWLDVTPTSRIITRVTNDVRAIDDTLPIQLWPISSLLVAMLVRVFNINDIQTDLVYNQVKFSTVILYAPIFFFPGFLAGVLGGWIGQIYISSQLPVKRMMSNTRAPVLAQYVSVDRFLLVYHSWNQVSALPSLV
jgi:hypothetical protein